MADLGVTSGDGVGAAENFAAVEMNGSDMRAGEWGAEAGAGVEAAGGAALKILEAKGMPDLATGVSGLDPAD